MKLFIDSANVDHIKEIADLGVICGVTTNPTLIAREGKDFKEVIFEILKLVDGPISGEVISLDAENMVKEGREIAKMHKNMVVKIPMTGEGLKAVHQLTKEGIKTNVTLIFNVSQALLAARAGATYVSPFIGRLEDILTDGTDVVRQIREVYDTYGIQTEIIAASIKYPKHFQDAMLAGAHIATVPYPIFKLALHHPLTDNGIRDFMADWQKVFGNKS